MIKSRFYTQDDKDAVIETFYSNVGKYFAAFEISDFEKFLKEMAEKSYYLVFYSEDNPEKVLACGGCGYFEDEIFLRWGMVNQDVHQQGIGTQLLLQRLKVAKEHFGEVDVYIDTSQHVQGFYEKFGFTAISSIKDGFAPNIDTVRMRFKDWK